MTPEQTIKLYEQDTNAEAKIREAITNAYQGLKPESELVHTYENAQFPSFYAGMSGYGNDLQGLSPTTRLQNAWGEQGRMSTAAGVARDAFDVRKTGMEDLIGTGVKQWGMGYQGAQNAYDRWWAQEQAAEEKRRWEAQMAMQREQMRRSSAPRNGYTPPPTPQGLTPGQLAELKAAYEEETRYNANVKNWNDYGKPAMIADQTKRNNDPWVKFGNSINKLFRR